VRLLTPEVTSFIRASLRSVWSLELLLLIRGGGARQWTAEELTRELRASRLLVNGILADFIKSGLVVQAAPERFEYRAASPALAELVDALAGIYAERPTAVIAAIVNAPRSNLESFADAFKFRNKPGGK